MLLFADLLQYVIERLLKNFKRLCAADQEGLRLAIGCICEEEGRCALYSRSNGILIILLHLICIFTVVVTIPKLRHIQPDTLRHSSQPAARERALILHIAI